MFKKKCNNTVKYGKCNYGTNCNFASSHQESKICYEKLKREKKCAWCFLGHCSPERCRIVPTEKPKKKITSSDGWTTVKPKEVTKKLTLEEELLLWVKNLLNNIDTPMPKITGKVIVTCEDKKLIFSEGRGFVIRQKTKFIVEEIKFDNKPVPLSLVWKEPPSNVYSNVESDLENLLKETDSSQIKIESEESEESEESDEEEEHNSQLYNIGSVQEKSAWDEFDN